jgi:hypothetical protein
MMMTPTPASSTAVPASSTMRSKSTIPPDGNRLPSAHPGGIRAPWRVELVRDRSGGWTARQAGPRGTAQLPSSGGLVDRGSGFASLSGQPPSSGATFSRSAPWRR